jgi:hypothetical protein
MLPQQKIPSSIIVNFDYCVMKENKDSEKGFAEQNDESGNEGLIQEFIGLLKHNKKWWITPIIISLLIIGLIIILGGSSIAPLIYPF